MKEERIVRIPVRRAEEEIGKPNRETELREVSSPEMVAMQTSDRDHQVEQAQAVASEETVGQDAQSLAETVAAEETINWKDRYLRMQADLVNLRRRLEQRYAEQAGQEKARLLHDLLPLADHLEMALQHADGSADSLRQGVELTLKSFLDTLQRHGVEPMETVGKPFDPNLHEAVGVELEHEVASGTVVAEERKGYLLNGKLLRPARVRVSA